MATNPKFPRRNRGWIVPKPHVFNHCPALCTRILLPIRSRLIPFVALVMPGESSLDLLEADIPIAKEYFSDDPAVTVTLVEFHGYELPGNGVRQMIF